LKKWMIFISEYFQKVELSCLHVMYIQCTCIKHLVSWFLL
jgi:hypothetical protein